MARIRRKMIGWLAVASCVWWGAAGCGSGGNDAVTASIPADGASAATTGSSVTTPAGLGSEDGDQFPGSSSEDNSLFPERPHSNPYPVVEIQTSLGKITLKLDAEHAPITVDNFLANYAERGFYEGTIFHYVDHGFMILGGGYGQDMTAKETRTEILNEAYNGLKNVRGTIGMARLPDVAHSATSQFYINLADNSTLDHRGRESAADYGYCVFGQVIEGMDVVDRIASQPVQDTGDFVKVPTTPFVIQSVKRIK